MISRFFWRLLLRFLPPEEELILLAAARRKRRTLVEQQALDMRRSPGDLVASAYILVLVAVGGAFLWTSIFS